MDFWRTLAIVSAAGSLSHLSAEQITARYYPEKQHYLVGEPIIVVYEIVNNSPKGVLHNVSSCRHNQFKVDHASPKRTIELYGCGDKILDIHCLESNLTIDAHGKDQERFLLEGPFTLDSPGKYHARATRAEHIKGVKGNNLSVELNVVSEFDIDLRAPKPGELEAAYQPFFDELASWNPMVQSLAASAISQNPPAFTEPVLLKLLDTEASSPANWGAIEGLQRLATPSSRAKLVELASPASSKQLQQPSIQVLGMVGNPEDCQAILAIAAASKDYTQAEAYSMAGRICTEAAVPTLASLVDTVDRQLRLGVTWGLEKTHSRGAVAPLISLLQNADTITRGNVETGLATLTHRKSKYGVEDQDAAKQSHTEWLQWWSVNGSTAPIYGSDQCVAPQPLL